MGPGGFSSFFRDLCDFGVSADDFVVIIRIMGNKAVRAVFDALFRITEIASAPFTECIKRAVTKQTIKMVCVNPFVTGKEFAFPITEEFLVFCFFVIHNRNYKSNQPFVPLSTVRKCPDAYFNAKINHIVMKTELWT